MAQSANTIRTIELAQQLISSYGGKQLVADGWWGSTTNASYLALDSEHRQVIDGFLRSQGTSAGQLKLITDERRSVSGSKAAAVKVRQNASNANDEILAIIRGVAAEEGIPAKTMLTIARLESNFNPKAKSPTGAKGLFQMTSIAVKDVIQRGKPSFDLTGKEYDARANAIAGARYIKILSNQLGVKLDNIPAIYMAFNIGPTGSAKYLAGKVDSSVANLISKQPKSMLSGKRCGKAQTARRLA